MFGMPELVGSLHVATERRAWRWHRFMAVATCSDPTACSSVLLSSKPQSYKKSPKLLLKSRPSVAQASCRHLFGVVDSYEMTILCMRMFNVVIIR